MIHISQAPILFECPEYKAREFTLRYIKAATTGLTSQLGMERSALEIEGESRPEDNVQVLQVL